MNYLVYRHVPILLRPIPTINYSVLPYSWSNKGDFSWRNSMINNLEEQVRFDSTSYFER